MDETLFPHSTAGNYIDTLNTIYGCDSIVNLNLTLRAAPVVTLSWQQMLQDSLLYIFENDTVAVLPCSNVVIIPLSGGYPLGGTYSGPGVLADSLNLEY